MDNLKKKKKGKNNKNRKPQAYAEEAEKPLDGAISDPRFAHLHTDPRFMRVPRHNNKVSIDSRFSSMFHDRHFAASSSVVDKRGRRKKKQDKHDLHRYYHLSDTEDVDNAGAGDNNNNKAPAQEENNLESVKNAEEIAQADDERTETELKEKKNKKNNKKKKNKKNVSDERFLSGEEESEEESKLEKKKKNADDSAVKTETDKKGNFKDLNKKNKKNKSKNVSEERFLLSQGEEELQEESKVGKKKNKNKNALDFILDERFRLRDKDISEEESKVGKKKKKNKNASVPVIDERFRLSDDGEDISEEESKIGKKKKKNKDASALVSDERFRLNEEDILDEEAKVGKKKRKDMSVVKERFGDVGVRGGGEKLQKLKKKGEDRALDLGDVRGKDGKKNVEVNFDDDDEEMETVFGSGDSEASGSDSSSDEDESNSEVLSSESESDDESFSDEEGYGSEMSAELSKEEVPTLENETRRLAAVNMDWNHVKAVDLLVLMNSFLPKGGQILSVAVYPSEFGKKRMEEEAVRGPSIFHANEDSSEEEEEDSETLNEKLRQYEKEKLRYYFAVIEFDSPATADYLYKACDKVEFERTSNVMDLRFIPDDMEFKESPRDVAREVPATYEAPDYQTRALQHSKVNVSWDEDEPQRVKTLHRKFDSKQVNEMDYKDYLASEDDLSDGIGDESDDVETVEKKEKLKEKYRSLLMESGHSDEDSEDKTEDKDMEITFNTGLEELGKRISEKKQREEETVWDAYLRRRKEKRKEKRNLSKQSEDDSLYSSEEENTGKRSNDHSDDFFMDEDSIDVTRDKKEKVKSSKVKKSDKKQEEGASKAELELLLADDNGRETGIKGYNLKSFKGKKRGLPEGEDKLPSFDLNDPRFSALFSNHNYAVDPTDPLFKRSEAYSRIIAQRQQKKFIPESDDTKASIEAETNDGLPNTKKRKYEISQLVNSVKRKVGSLNSKI